MFCVQWSGVLVLTRDPENPAIRDYLGHDGVEVPWLDLRPHVALWPVSPLYCERSPPGANHFSSRRRVNQESTNKRRRPLSPTPDLRPLQPSPTLPTRPRQRAIARYRIHRTKAQWPLPRPPTMTARVFALHPPVSHQAGMVTQTSSITSRQA